MSISLPLIYSLPDENKKSFLSVLMELTLLPTDLQFIIFDFIKLETVISVLKSCSYFSNSLTKHDTLKYLQQNAQKETNLITDNYTLDDLIRLSQLRTASGIDRGDQSLIIMTNDNKLYLRPVESSEHMKHWKQVSIPTTDCAQLSIISGLIGRDCPFRCNNHLSWIFPPSKWTKVVKITRRGWRYNGLALMKCGKIMEITEDIKFIDNKNCNFDNKIVDISCVHDHVLVLCDNGTVYSFGYGSDGQLGYNCVIKTLVPALIPNLYNVVQISGGASHSIVLTKDGLVYSFGSNNRGQLGLQNVTQTHYPTLVPGLENIIQIATGHAHTLALRNDGKVYAFGSYTGKREEFPYFTKIPTLINNLSNVERLWTKHSESLFIKKNGDIIQLKDNELVPIGSMYN